MIGIVVVEFSCFVDWTCGYKMIVQWKLTMREEMEGVHEKGMS